MIPPKNYKNKEQPPESLSFMRTVVSELVHGPRGGGGTSASPSNSHSLSNTTGSRVYCREIMLFYYFSDQMYKCNYGATAPLNPVKRTYGFYDIVLLSAFLWGATTNNELIDPVT